MKVSEGGHFRHCRRVNGYDNFITVLHGLTHQVFEHGLLMSQQVINDGFPPDLGGQETATNYSKIRCTRSNFCLI